MFDFNANPAPEELHARASFIRDLLAPPEPPAPKRPAKAAPKAPRRAAPKPRALPARATRAARPNYRGRSTRRTVQRQSAILALLEAMPEGLTVSEIGRAVGMSRQLALYHVKKLAAQHGLILAFEPCLVNGGLQLRCWTPMAASHHFAQLERMAA